MTDVTNRTRVQPGVPTGGEFAVEAKAENDMAFDDSTFDPFTQPQLQALAPTHPVICQVERGTELTDLQLSELFEGGYREVDDEFRRANFDLIEEGHQREIYEWLNRAHEAGLTDRGIDDLSDEEIEAFEEYLDERDDSDPISELAENAPPKVMRALIGMPDLYTEEKPPVEQKMVALRSMLSMAGLEPDDEDEFRQFAEVAPWGNDAQLDVVWFDHPKNALPSIVQGDRTEFDLRDPYVTMVNGKTGEAVELKTRGTRTIKYPEWEAKRFDDNDCQDVPFIDGAAWGASMNTNGYLAEDALACTPERRDFTNPDTLRQSGGYTAYTKGWTEMAETIANPDATPTQRVLAISQACAGTEATWSRDEREYILPNLVNSLIPNAPQQVAKDLAYKASYAHKNHREDSAESQRVMTEWSAATGGNPKAHGASRTAWGWTLDRDLHKAIETWG